MDFISPTAAVVLSGLACGVVLGVAGRSGRFCTLAMLEDAWFGRDLRRLKAFALAAGCALAATQALAVAGLVDLEQSIYLGNSFGLVGAIAGGLMFGLGMALVGTCGFGTLVRIGGGDLRAIVVFLVLGLSALAALHGVTGVLRLRLVEPLAIPLPAGTTQDIGSLVAAATGHDLRRPLAALIALALAGWALADKGLRRSPRLLAAGLAVGLAVAAGWLATGYLGADDFEPARVASLTFVSPLGRTLMYVTTFSGASADFGVASVFGVVLGSFAAALADRRFRWEACDDARELKRHLAGAALMGTGGVLAMGCTIGQGLTAFSALAMSAPAVMAAVAVGARLGLEFTMTGEWLPAVRGLSKLAEWSRWSKEVGKEGA